MELAMDELSDEVKAFLARAQREHEVPDVAVKQRVRAGVAAALVTAPVALAPASAGAPEGALTAQASLGKVVATWSLGAKLAVAAVTASIVGAGTLLLPRTDRPLPGSASVAAAPATTREAPGELATARQPTESAPLGAAAALAGARAEARAPAAPAALDQGAESGEVALLLAASDALDRRDDARGLALLEQHRAQYPRSALEQERRGLALVARCLQRAVSAPRDARAEPEARAFLKRFPTAVLTTRIKRACKL
jgi:hypothetical protein